MARPRKSEVTASTPSIRLRVSYLEDYFTSILQTNWWSYFPIHNALLAVQQCHRRSASLAVIG